MPQSFLDLFSALPLDEWIAEAKTIASQGNLPHYIPLLAQANPNTVAVAIADSHNQIVLAGDIHQTFPLMSVVKPLMLLYLLETVGAKPVFDRVDRLASTEPFNAIPHGKPKNPMLNAGAIALAALLPSGEILAEWLNLQAGTQLFLDERMLASVRSLSNRRNIEIAEVLEALGCIENAAIALDNYERVCCLSATVETCARLGLLLACDPSSENMASSKNIAERISQENREIAIELVKTCGMYADSEKFAEAVGLPAKSAVSGVIVAPIPDWGAIAVYSPTLDAIGNSVAGLFLLQKIYAAMRDR